jgi:hypothetical protein
MKKTTFIFCHFEFSDCFAQSTSYWQQHVDYKMDVSMDVKHILKGKELVYNNSLIL